MGGGLVFVRLGHDGYNLFQRKEPKESLLDVQNPQQLINEERRAVLTESPFHNHTFGEFS
jgi:hypothetical protein